MENPCWGPNIFINLELNISLNLNMAWVYSESIEALWHNKATLPLNFF